MSRKPYIATTALPTLPAKDYNDWAENIYNELRQGYPTKLVSAAVDREDNTVEFYNAGGDCIRSERLDRIMGDRCMEIFERESANNDTDYASRFVSWQDLGTDNFREVAEDQVKWWAGQFRLDVTEVWFV